MSNNKVIIGWRERIELLDFDVRLKAKIDTGAKSSSLDVSEIRREGDIVFFKIRLSRKKTTKMMLTCQFIEVQR